MIKTEQGSSMYDFMSNDHEAPVPEKGIQITERKPLEREVNWQSSNNERFKRDLPDHVKDAMATEQPDRSYYEFDNLAFGRNPRDNFGAKVNQAFGKLAKGFDFRAEKARYIKFYKQLMQEI